MLERFTVSLSIFTPFPNEKFFMFLKIVRKVVLWRPLLSKIVSAIKILQYLDMYIDFNFLHCWTENFFGLQILKVGLKIEKQK